MASENLKGVHDWGVENGKFKETHMTPKEYRKSKSSPVKSKALEKKKSVGEKHFWKTKNPEAYAGITASQREILRKEK